MDRTDRLTRLGIVRFATQEQLGGSQADRVPDRARSEPLAERGDNRPLRGPVAAGKQRLEDRFAVRRVFLPVEPAIGDRVDQRRRPAAPRERS